VSDDGGEVVLGGGVSSGSQLKRRATGSASRLSGRFLPWLKGTIGPAGRGGTASRHLVLAYRPRWQSLDDLQTIAGHIKEIDPSIRTFILPGTEPNSVSRRAAAVRPSLIVSPGPLTGFRPIRGKVYQGSPIAKLVQLDRLASAGVAAPRTEVLTPELRLDPAGWGDFVVLKPSDMGSSSRGRGIQLVATRRVRYLAQAEYPEDHPGRRAPMLVQQFIDTGERLTLYRVLTLLGEPLYCQFMRSRDPRVDLSAPDDVIEAAVIANQRVEEDEFFVNEPDVLAVARAAHAAMPEIPLKGCDIIREAASGRLYVLEVNPGGNTWHFSSRFLADIRDRNGPDFEMQRLRQFDAFRTAARVLAEAVLREAT
jgi:hypothetical protein